MNFKIDKRLLPIKAHFFFFFAALGPLLPQMNVFGRQLGISADVMGMVTAVLPLLWAAAKPLFGYVVDYWPSQRKLVFMLLIVVMTGSYCGLWFLPMPEEPESSVQLLRSVYQFNNTVTIQPYNIDHSERLQMVNCHWSCERNYDIHVYLPNSSLVNSVYVDGAVNDTSCSFLRMHYVDTRGGQVICSPKDECNLMCFEEGINGSRKRREISGSKDANSLEVDDRFFGKIEKERKDDGHVYMTVVFWVFVVLMCMGTVAFNVANCIGDAVCFDVLGAEAAIKYGAQRAWGTAGYGAEAASKYGAQRAWGTAGYGITALLGGWLVDLVSGTYKDFTPAFIVAIVATAIDLYSCRSLKLPSLSSPDDSGKALRDVLKIPRVMIFIVFAVVAGTFDSFIIYYMFW
ncbi:hypothetical protein RR46_01190 [Papilio xuthus]|uniref:Major facilitator superfamily associated domain-containing protein n=1 Tax=Papilio xuthus TaxID=66420 RepID=A0A0N1I5K0_PAPXU|nr:hypothetical protein RR46_01190 [Papilio xuthus]